MDYHRQYGVDIRIVRIFNTYGPRMAIDDGRVVSNFIVSALKNEPLTIYGDGSQTRSFCYVNDLVDGILRMLWQENSTGPVNLGTNFEMTMIELAELILKLTESSSILEYKELPIDDPKQRRPDLTVAKTLLNWTPSSNPEMGLLKTIEYFKSVI
jgi:UDP-glucuronate decarboxylase